MWRLQKKPLINNSNCISVLEDLLFGAKRFIMSLVVMGRLFRFIYLLCMAGCLVFYNY
jgi:hypothetical protein